MDILLLIFIVLFILFRHLVPGLVAGLALYLILHRVSDSFARRMPHTTARPLALATVTLIAALVAIGAIALAVTFLRRHAGNVPAMMTKMAEILQSTRAWLGGYGEDVIPEVMTDAETLKLGVVAWLKEHASSVATLYPTDQPVLTAESPLGTPISRYGASKVDAAS